MAKSTERNSPVIVSCARDPLDLRPALDVLEREVLQRTRHGNPLVVLMGETHAVSAHKLLQQGLLARLRGRVAYGLEEQHNRLEKFLRTLGVPQDLARTIQESDLYGDKFLKVSAMLRSTDAPVAGRNILQYCLKSGVPVQANDLSKIYTKNGSAYLDISDDFTRNVVPSCLPESVSKRVNCESGLGMALRNSAMVTHSLAHSQHVGADVYVQSCGYNHLMGDKDDFRYRHSLSAIFSRVGAETGLQVMPVFIKSAYTEEAVLPHYAHRMLGNAVIVEDLDTASFEGISAAAGEYRHLLKLKKHSGHEIKVFRYADMQEDSPAFNRLINDIYSWMCQAKKLAAAAPRP